MKAARPSKQHPVPKRPPVAMSMGAFVAAIVRSPRTVGAIAPSSRWLARAMAKHVDGSKPGLVIELGAGSGVVTYALLEAGVKPENLLVVEREPVLCRMLVKHFPGVQVVEWDAMQLHEELERLGSPRVNAVVSSLPLLAMPITVREAIARQMLAAVQGAGPLIQFTYGPKSPIRRKLLAKHQAKARRAALVMRNIPPATVWKYES